MTHKVYVFLWVFKGNLVGDHWFYIGDMKLTFISYQFDRHNGSQNDLVNSLHQVPDYFVASSHNTKRIQILMSVNKKNIHKTAALLELRIWGNPNLCFWALICSYKINYPSDPVG